MRTLVLGLILLWLTNLCFCHRKVSWKEADTFGDTWKKEIAALPAFQNQDLMLLKHKGTDEVYFQGDRVDGNTDYAIANLKLKQIVKIRVTQQEIFRAAAKKQSAHLINSNTKFYKKLPLTHVYFTKIESDLQKYSETIKDISDNPKKTEKFQLIHDIMKKITRLDNMTPKFYFESNVTKENLQICAFVFDATVLETWAHTHRFYFTGYDGEGESSTDLPEEEILAADETTDDSGTSTNDSKEPTVDNDSPNSAVVKPQDTPVTNSPYGSSTVSDGDASAASNSTSSVFGSVEETNIGYDLCIPYSDMPAWSKETFGGNGTSNVNLVSCSNQKILKGVDGERRFNGAGSGESDNRQSKKKPTLERGYIRKNGFGIAVVIIKGGASAKKLSFFGSHVLVAKCTNSRYLNKLVRRKHEGNSWDILQTADWTEFAKTTAGVKDEFKNNKYESAEMIDFNKDVTTHVTLSFHKGDGTTDYAVVERNVQSRQKIETKIVYRAPQDLICREMAKDMCLDLLCANKDFFKSFCVWFTSFSDQNKKLVRTIELIKFEEGKEENKFLQQIVKQFLGVTPRPYFQFTLQITEAETYIYGIIFDASNAIWDEDIKYINLHDALLEIVSEKTGKPVKYENAEPCAFHQNGFGIALVLANGPVFKIDQSREYASNVLLARVKNQTYIQEILTKDMPNVFVRASAAFENAFKRGLHTVKTAVQKIPWSWCKDWESGFSYKWNEVYHKLSMTDEGNGCLCLEYGTAKSLLEMFRSPHIHFYRFFMATDKSLLVVVWIDQDFPDQIVILKKVVIEPKKMDEKKKEEETTKPNFAKKTTATATTAVNVITNMIANGFSINSSTPVPSENKVVEPIENVTKNQVIKDALTGLIVEKNLDIGCSGYKGWKAVEDKNPHRPLELYIQDFVELYCDLEHHWKILLVKKTSIKSRNKYLMVYGTHYEFLEENMNKPWFAQENYSYFCALIEKNPRNKLTASRNKGSDPAKKIIAALAYGQESWDAIPIVYDLQNEYIRLQKAPIYADFQYLLQVGLEFRAAYYTTSDGIATTGYRVKNYSFSDNIWTESNYIPFVYTTASKVEELLTSLKNEATSPRLPLARTLKAVNLAVKDLTYTAERATGKPDEPKKLQPDEDVTTCGGTAIPSKYPNRSKWKKVCILAGYKDFLNFIQFDSSGQIHFYLLEAPKLEVPKRFKYLLLIAYIDDKAENIEAPSIVVLHKAELTEKAFIKFAARRNFVGLFKRWYHTQTIMHRTVGQKILFDEIELTKYEYPTTKQPEITGTDASTKAIEDKEAVVLLSTRHEAFKGIMRDQRNKFNYYKSNVYFDQKYGFHYLRAFVFQKTNLKTKVHECTGIGNISPIFGEKRMLYTSLTESDNEWKTVVMITKAEFMLRDMKHSALAYGSGANPVETADNNSEVDEAKSESKTHDEQKHIEQVEKSANKSIVLKEILKKLENNVSEATDEEGKNGTKGKEKDNETQDTKASTSAKTPTTKTPEKAPKSATTQTDKKPTKKENKVNANKVFRYQKYGEGIDLKRWVLEETPAYTGWIPIRFFGIKEDIDAYDGLQSYLRTFANFQYKVLDYWTLLLVKERTKLAFLTRYYLVFGYHGTTNKEHKTNGQKYFCALIHKHYKYMLADKNSTEKHGVVIALAFDLNALDVIGTVMDLEDAYLAQQNDIMGVAHLASLTLKQGGNLFPTLQHCVQRDKQFRVFHYKLNTNVDAIGYFMLMYTYDVYREAWIGCDAKTFGTGDERHKQLMENSGKLLTKVSEEAATHGTPTSTTKSPNTTTISNTNTATDMRPDAPPKTTTDATPQIPAATPTTMKDTVGQIPELEETYKPLAMPPQQLPLWQNIATLDKNGLQNVSRDSDIKWNILKDKTFQENIENRLKLCGCTIVNKEDVKKVKYLDERKGEYDRYSVILGISENSYFFVHLFNNMIVFYRPNIPTYVGALSATEHYWNDIVDWISATSNQAAIPQKILDVQIELKKRKFDPSLPIEILYYTQIPNIGYLAIFLIGNNYYLLRLQTKTGEKKWGFKCQRVETLLRIRKSYVISDDGWNAYDHHVKLIWIENPYPSNRKITPKHAPAFYNILGQLGRLREWALGQLYRKIQNPLKFEERKNRLRIWLADSLQKDPIIESYGIYDKADEHSAKFVKDINGAGGEDLSRDMKQIFVLVSIQPFMEKTDEQTSSAPKIAEMFRIFPKTSPVSTPQLDRYQVVNVINFTNVDLDFSLGGYSSSFFANKELAQDAVGLENMLNEY